MTRTRLKEYAQNIYLYRYSEGPSGRSPSGKLDQTFLVRPHFWNLTLHISRYVHHLATIASHLRPVLATVAFPLRPVGGLDGGNQTILIACIAMQHENICWRSGSLTVDSGILRMVFDHQLKCTVRSVLYDYRVFYSTMESREDMHWEISCWPWCIMRSVLRMWRQCVLLYKGELRGFELRDQ